MFIEATVTISRKEYEELKATIDSLKATIVSLQTEIRLLKNGKNSNSSHTPPSQDLGRSNQKNSRE
ncbi:MAG: septum formation initiator family protein, partial [Vicingaceae bacterium]|nr:septum formation initiator family protein [Vicingaceae bacterium]